MTEPLAVTPDGRYEPMTYRAAFRALTTPGVLPVTVGGQAASQLLADAYLSSIAGVLAGEYRVRAAAHLPTVTGPDHPRYYATYTLRVTPADLTWEEVQQQDLGVSTRHTDGAIGDTLWR